MKASVSYDQRSGGGGPERLCSQEPHRALHGITFDDQEYSEFTCFKLRLV